MISRQWRGLVKVACAAEYEEHLKTETFPALSKMPGFIDASIMTRRLDHAIEYLVVTRWKSLEAISRFAGADLEAAVVPAKVQPMMVEYDVRVRHYEIVE
jgi:heme-degrading monooxygenase HmoA